MNVTHKITMDLTRPTNGNRINVVEGDRNSRIVNVHLYENSVNWEIPDEAIVLIKWERESGVGGEYNQLSDGSPAWSASGNILTITLSEESTKYSGTVKFSIILETVDSQISTFVITANVHAVANGKEETNSGSTSTDVSELQRQIGNLAHLETKNKSNLVSAINEAAKSGGGTGSDSGQNGNGLSAEASALLITILRNGVYSTDQSANITALAEALAATEEEPDIPVVPDEPDEPDEPEVTLSSISATYSGGDVAVGTAMDGLTGIVVTAHYSDGSTETVTDYTLSGEIAEGKNTITVTYQGKTATFTVNGIAEPTGENNGWVNGQAYELNKVDCLKLDTTTGETLEAESGTMVTDFLPCLGVSAVSYEAFDAASILNCVLYDEEKNFIKANGLLQATDPTSGNIYTYLPLYHVIPEGTAYIRFTQRSSIKHLTSVTPHKYPVLGETTECETGRWYESGAVLGSLSADKGTLTVDDTQTWYVTGYCMVYGASKVHFSQSTRKIVVFYDGNKNYISGTTVNNTTAFEIPENAVYMAASSVDMNNLHIWLEA